MRVPKLEWIEKNLQIAPNKETSGPWDRQKVPHAAGVLDEYDDPATRIILLPWGARAAKTTTAVAATISEVHQTGLPGVFMAPDEARADGFIADDYYPVLESCPETKTKLLPIRARNKKRGIQLGNALIRRSYAGSPSTTAGYPAAVIHITEAGSCGSLGRGKKESAQIDAHPIYRALKRAFLFPYDSKAIIEGTPKRKGDCVLDELVMAPSTQRRHFFVPCPHCGTYQRLQWSPDFGHHPTSGVKWDKGPSGHSDPLTAARTAYYECEQGCRIENADRPEMMRAGVWVAEGQKVSGIRRGGLAAGRRAGRSPAASAVPLTGTPDVESDTIAFGETRKAGFSTLYSLMISGWGQLAKEWVSSLGNPERLRDFINQVLGLVYDPKPRQIEPHELQVRLKSDVPLGTCPDWTRFLTWWGDVGRIGDTLLFYWGVMAWGQHGRGAFVDYDVAYGETELGEHIARMKYPVLGQRDEFRLRPIRGGLDAGGNKSDEGVSSTVEVYRIADALRVFATRGSSVRMTDWYDWGIRKAGRSQREIARRRKHSKGDLFFINHDLSQRYVEERLSNVVKADAPNGLTFPAEMCDPNHVEHAHIFEELLNEFLDGDTWTRTGDNERRDVLRGNRALAEEYILSSKRTWADPPSLLTEDRSHARQSVGAALEPTTPTKTFRAGGFRVRRD